MNVYKWTVTIDGHEGPMIDDLEEARRIARTNQGVLTEYEFEYADSQVIEDFTEAQS